MFSDFPKDFPKDDVECPEADEDYDSSESKLLENDPMTANRPSNYTKIVNQYLSINKVKQKDKEPQKRVTRSQSKESYRLTICEANEENRMKEATPEIFFSDSSDK